MRGNNYNFSYEDDNNENILGNIEIEVHRQISDDVTHYTTLSNSGSKKSDKCLIY
jgi:hypothetical protein